MDNKATVESTKASKQRRVPLIKAFLSQIREDGSWKQYVNDDGSLRLTEVRKHLGVLEGGVDAPAWNEDYFKSKHSTFVYRQEFETWVKTELARREDHDFPSGFIKEHDIGLPLWLEEELMSDAVRNFIIDQAKRLIRMQEQIQKMRSQLDAKERKLLEVQIEKDNLLANYNSADEAFSLGIRTLRYD